MAIIDYEDCYAALQLNFGAGVKEVNQRWRKLSRIHHPDQHAGDLKTYRQALEKQIQLNNARDILKKWFEMNPNSMPPRNTRSTNHGNTQDKSANSHSGNCNSASQSRTSGSNSQQGSAGGSSANGTHSSQTKHYHWQSNAHAGGSASSQQKSEQSAASGTGWFDKSAPNLTPLQELVHKIDLLCSGGSPSVLAMVRLWMYHCFRMRSIAFGSVINIDSGLPMCK